MTSELTSEVADLEQMRDIGASPSASSATSAAPSLAAADADAGLGALPVDGRTIKVSFHHGSIGRSEFSVLVGHYTSTPLDGAERFADRQFGGRLSERLARDHYPANIGESMLARAPRRAHPAQGVLVVGLGEYGELTELRLVETIRAALVRHGLNQADGHDGPEPLELGISSVLLGSTGDQALSTAGSVRAIVDGVREANWDLRSGEGPERVSFTSLQLWEWNAAEAELAFRALVAPATSDLTEARRLAHDVIVDDDLHEAGGALMASAPTENIDAAWWYVRVTARPDDDVTIGDPAAGHLVLEFSVGGRMARTGNIVHRVERRMLDRLVRRALESSRLDAGVHTTMFEILFPKQLKWALMAAQHIQLEVDDVTADIPWEMLAARNPGQGTRGQLALRAPFVRQLRLPEMPVVRRSTKPHALVIGNPPLGSNATALPGAYREALAVTEVLGGSDNDYVVKSLCFDVDEQSSDSTTMSIETALFDDDYRIIHIAAHGLLRPDDPSRHGVAIGPDAFLTAQTFRQLNVTPDLVFLNCCHLAAVQTDLGHEAIDNARAHLNQLGASLARQLVDSGVRAVVVAGWAVDDAAAASFARTFYDLMLCGTTFGQAVYGARLAAQETSPKHSTWGAYQCYGDGGYTLPSSTSRRSPSNALVPLTAREASRRIEMLVGDIEIAGVGGADGVALARTIDELRAIEDAARQRGWATGCKGRLCEEMGRAWAAVGDYRKAVSWYEDARDADDGGMSLRGLEELVNLKDRSATALARKPDATEADRADGARLNQEALDMIELLEQVVPSGERIALRAGHQKRRATASIGAERAEALTIATRAYRESYDLQPLPYTLFNYVQLEEIRSRIVGAESEAASLHGVVEFTRAELRLSSDFDYWDAVVVADGLLTHAIINDAVPAVETELVDRYTEAFDCRSRASQRSSTLDHLVDLADLHPDPAQAEVLRSIHAQLVDDDV